LAAIITPGNLCGVVPILKPYKAGRLVNQIKKLAEDVCQLPRLKRSPDPGDDFLLALAEAGRADYLVTGDRSGLLVFSPVTSPPGS
jgi:predicted nucleic acid-binding protein